MNQDRTPRAIFVFWLPLALQWVMMAMEGPFLAAVIARLADPTFNLAAYGVAFAFAILVESPVIMLMSASTALVEDADSYRKLLRFSHALNLLSTGLLVLLLIPPVHTFVMVTAVGLPLPVADLVYGALWILLPWPAAIGYRRFLHGVLIRSGRTRRVAYGTGFRLVAMVGTALVLAGAGIPGVWVGAAALSVGVVVEGIVAWWMARGAVGELLAPTPPSPGLETSSGVSDVSSRALEPRPPVSPALGAGVGAPPVDASSGDGPLSYGSIARFYYPLALTSFIGLTTQPLLTFFMGRAPSPVESLAVFPVVIALTFLFSTLGLSFQEAAIALVGRNREYARELGRFATGLSAAAALGLGTLAFTPLADVWFRIVSGLPADLADLAISPIRIAVILPFLSVIQAFQRALLVQARVTRPITLATGLEVAGIAILFPLLGSGFGYMGVTAAIGALAGGRILGVAFLTWAQMTLTPGRVRRQG